MNKKLKQLIIQMKKGKRKKTRKSKNWKTGKLKLVLLAKYQKNLMSQF